MALTPRLDLRQTQSLVMTPQLQQAIKLLQLSSLELASYVEGQLEQNPLLEQPDPVGADGFDGVEAAASDVAPARDDDNPRSIDEAFGAEAPGGHADADLDIDSYENLFDSEPHFADAGVGGGAAVGSGPGRGGSFDDSEANLEEVVSERTTLKDHLHGQISVDLHDPVDRIIAVHLVDLLDESGYLTGPLDGIAEWLGCPVGRVEETLAKVQSFDPPGVFARSLAECLTLQLKDQGRYARPIALVLDHLDLVAKRDWTALAKATQLNAEHLIRLVNELRALNPKPALAFDESVAQRVVPDVIMRAQPTGGWSVELNSDTLPRVLVNNQYYAQVSRTLKKREERQYLNECMQSANWLVKSLHQRATTILKVATEIIRQQNAFFTHGVRALKPLVLRDIAEAIGMHESTVSRVTANKYVATPLGIYELKYFFTHAIGASHGSDGHAAESVRYRLKALIDEEPANGVLSDDALAEILQKEGVDIARRTIAKYREAMSIPSSVQRRRQKSGGF